MRPSPRSAAASASSSATWTSRATSRPRSSPTQHGNVVVAGTRDCSLQRRFQKLVEEAPAPFLHRRAAHGDPRVRQGASARRPATTARAPSSTWSARTALISFLEVNTRLQVEHPVTEETAGIDLVLQQFKIANGEALDITEDPTPRGHSFEFRINGEDAGRGFLPAPGPVTKFERTDAVRASGWTPAWSPAPSSAASSTRCWPS